LLEVKLTRSIDNSLSISSDESAGRLSKLYDSLLGLAEHPATDVAEIGNQDTGCQLDEDSLAQLDDSSEDQSHVRSN